MYALPHQTLPEEESGPKWQQDWGLIGKNPGVRLESFCICVVMFIYLWFLYLWQQDCICVLIFIYLYLCVWICVLIFVYLGFCICGKNPDWGLIGKNRGVGLASLDPDWNIYLSSFTFFKS